jgi:hypothetical protein
MFCLVSGIQEGETYDWGTITGFLSVPLLIGFGSSCWAVFVWWQGPHAGRTARAAVAVPRPQLLAVQRGDHHGGVRHHRRWRSRSCCSPKPSSGTRPRSRRCCSCRWPVFSGGLAPGGGPLRRHASTPLHHDRRNAALLDLAVLGEPGHDRPKSPSGSCCLPMACSAWPTPGCGRRSPRRPTRNLPPRSAGAGAGIYNTTRQVGAVLGRRAIAAVIEARLTANLGATAGSLGGVRRGRCGRRHRRVGTAASGRVRVRVGDVRGHDPALRRPAPRRRWRCSSSCAPASPRSRPPPRRSRPEASAALADA